MSYSQQHATSTSPIQMNIKHWILIYFHFLIVLKANKQAWFPHSLSNRKVTCILSPIDRRRCVAGSKNRSNFAGMYFRMKTLCLRCLRYPFVPNVCVTLHSQLKLLKMQKIHSKLIPWLPALFPILPYGNMCLRCVPRRRIVGIVTAIWKSGYN